VDQFFAFTLAGWFAGDLINYLAAFASPEDRYCSACQAPLILLNWFPWPRSCRICRHQINPYTWWVQFMATLAAILIWHWQPGINLALVFVALVYFGTASLVDIQHNRIPYTVNACGGLVGLVVGWSRRGMAPTLAGGIAALLLLLVVYFFGELLRRLLFKWQSHQLSSTASNLSEVIPKEPAFFGFGDVLFGVNLGLIVGWPDIWTCLLITLISAGIVGAVVKLVMLFRHRYRMNTALPLAPFFVFGAVWVLFV
jgi:prepilin signal peptidase PulO-like enzyme (type II secretory pathway)